MARNKQLALHSLNTAPGIDTDHLCGTALVAGPKAQTRTYTNRRTSNLFSFWATQSIGETSYVQFWAFHTPRWSIIGVILENPLL